jgi:hypothetical protein
MYEIQVDTYFEVLSDIEYSSDVQGALFIEVPERIGEIRRLDLPYPHEHKLMIWMAAQKHG